MDDAHIGVLSLDTGGEKLLLEGGHDPRYAPTGHLVYARAGTLRAVESSVLGPPQVRDVWQFKIAMMADEGIEVAEGEPVSVLTAVMTATGREKFERVLSRVPDVEPDERDRL